MCRLGFVLTLLILMLSSSTGQAAEYRLTNGDVYAGQAVSPNDDGIIVRLDIGGFSPRVPWGKLTQETLKQLMQDPEMAQFAEPYIDIPIEQRQAERQRQREIKVQEPPRVPRAEGRTGLFASLANPLGWTLLGIIYLANLYAAYEIARFRARPPGLVIGVSAIVPIIGPALFALLPSAEAAQDTSADAVPDTAATETVNPMQQALPTGMAGSGLGLASTGGGKGGGNPAYAQVYKRADTTFDRRFFETKFTGFFRVIPSDAEKDLVIVIKTPKQELVATRISRISASEVHFQLQRGTEASVGFGEITEVSVRPKGAK